MFSDILLYFSNLLISTENDTLNYLLDFLSLILQSFPNTYPNDQTSTALTLANITRLDTRPALRYV